MKELFFVIKRSIGPDCSSPIPVSKEIALALSAVLPHIVHSMCAKMIADALRNIVLMDMSNGTPRNSQSLRVHTDVVLGQLNYA